MRAIKKNRARKKKNRNRTGATSKNICRPEVEGPLEPATALQYSPQKSLVSFGINFEAVWVVVRVREKQKKKSSQGGRHLSSVVRPALLSAVVATNTLQSLKHDNRVAANGLQHQRSSC